MRVITAVLVALALGLLTFTGVAGAQQSGDAVKIEKRQLLVPRKGEAAESAAFADSPSQWLRDKQRSLYGAMASSLRRVRNEGGHNALWALVLISFGYGVFHAAGPGHGKTVISAWLLATEQQLRRGIVVAFLSAIVQALSAIVIVSSLLFVIGGAITRARLMAQTLETLSFAMIAALGAYLVWTAFRPGHGHHHASHDHDHHAHDHCHAHHHAHAPMAKDMDRDWSMARAASMAFAVGIRPCTGAILMLVASYPLGLFTSGLIAVFAMSAGTFLTVAAIAAIAVYGRGLAQRLAERSGGQSERVMFILRLGAGALIAILGASLFWASLGGGLAQTF